MRSALPLTLLLLAACGPQLGSTDEKTKVAAEEKKTVTDSGAQAGVEDAGSVTVPPGAIAAGSTLIVEQVPAPASFGVGTTVQAASPALQIGAKGSDGSELPQASAPMTVTLDLPAAEGGALALLPTATEDNLCVLLEAKDATLIVWRRAALALDGAARTASVQSPYFGTYQLVYCGSEPLPNFKDAALVGLSSEPKLTSTLTVPADFRAATGHGKYCGFVVGLGDDKNEIIAVAEASVTAGAAASLPLAVVGSLINDTLTYGVGVGLVAATTPCELEVGDDLKSATHKDALLELYVTKVPGATLRASGVTGTFGEGAYALSQARVAVGAADGVEIASPHAEPLVCIESSSPAGWVQVRTAIASDGAIGGAESLAMPVIGAGSAPSRLTAFLGVGCGHRDVDAANAKTGSPYMLHWPEQSLDDTFYLSPVNMKIQNSAPEIYQGNACVRIAPAGQSADLGQRLVSLSEPEYGIYLPFLAEPVYDLSVVLVTAEACSAVNTQVPAVPLKKKALSAEIVVELKGP
jgi:hypothetical protein